MGGRKRRKSCDDASHQDVLLVFHNTVVQSYHYRGYNGGNDMIVVDRDTQPVSSFFCCS